MSYTKVIINSGGNLDSYYEQVQQYLHTKYHTYASKLPAMTESMRADVSNGRGHISASGDEFGGLPAGFCVGSKVV